jgi:cholesterol transport system auxiliary component
MRLSMSRIPLLFALALSVLGMSACGVVGNATKAMDNYTLQPLPVVQGKGGSRHLVVNLPTASGALTTDRILIKPSALQAAYLPKGRWTDPVPQLVQTLLVDSLQNAGGFRLVGRDPAGLTPDFVALVEVNAFQAEAPAAGTTQTPVTVSLTISLLSATDNRLIATRRFDASQMAATTDTLTVVSAFDAATHQVLSDAVNWVNRTAH